MAAREFRSLGRLLVAAACAAAVFPLPAVADGTPAHTFASVSATMSTTVGSDVYAATSQESEAWSNLEVTAGWRNLYPSGGTYFTVQAARHIGLFPERASLYGGALGALVPGDDSHERFQIVQEFDDPKTGVERFEASAGMISWHGSTPYHERYVALDYFAGAVSRFGFDGPVRRFDVYTSYAQTLDGHVVEVSPTYSLPLGDRGRTSGWLSLTGDVPIGATVERYASVGAGVTRQVSRRLELAASATRYWSRDEVGAYDRRLVFSAGARLRW
ncbi:MAG TPA: hypothetical protein VFU90_14320 [Candidatus Tumulicola sp.]|nr:hypothetical protein [Candidatus Tumulicola sp.]